MSQVRTRRPSPTSSPRPRAVATAAVPLAAVLALGLAPAAPAAADPGDRRQPADVVPGSPGIGDPLFPLLGNGGYDVTDYDVAMTYAGPDRDVEAETTSAPVRSTGCPGSTSTSTATR